MTTAAPVTQSAGPGRSMAARKPRSTMKAEKGISPHIIARR